MHLTLAFLRHETYKFDHAQCTFRVSCSTYAPIYISWNCTYNVLSSTHPGNASVHRCAAQTVFLSAFYFYYIFYIDFYRCCLLLCVFLHLIFQYHKFNIKSGKSSIFRILFVKHINILTIQQYFHHHRESGNVHCEQYTSV